MSHNIHFVVVKAESPKDACIEVENAIEDWGNENNWRTIMGSISQDDEVYDHDNSHHYDLEPYSTIEMINAMLNRTLKFDPKDELLEVKQKIEQFLHGEKKPNKFEWYMCMRHMLEMYQKAPWLEKDFDILDGDEVFAWSLDEFGVTNLGYDGEEKQYVVLVDMHS